MKKLAFIVGLMLITITASAQTSRSTITLTSTGHTTTEKNVSFRIRSTFSDAFDNGYDSSNGNPGEGIYILHDGKEWTSWASNAYSPNLVLAFTSWEDTQYTLTFSNFTGTETYEVYDVIADQTILVNASTPAYTFTITDAEKNKVIKNRFLINYAFEPDEGELNICFNEKGTNILEIKNNPYTGKIAIKNAAGEDVLRSPYQPLKTPQEIDLSSLPAGRYTVILTKDDEEKKLIIVK